MSNDVVHRELRCVLPGCTADMRKDVETRNAVSDYLIDLATAVESNRVRHVSVSVHREEGAKRD